MQTSQSKQDQAAGNEGCLCGRTLDTTPADHIRCAACPLSSKAAQQQTTLPKVDLQTALQRIREAGFINGYTMAHIEQVRRFIRIFNNELAIAGEQHDRSKFSKEEAPFFDENSPELRSMTYGSQEYRSKINDPAILHHYKHNSHHPEFYPNGIDGMNLLGIVEMFLDWMAASKRHADGNPINSIEINAERFSMSPQLKAIFLNTVFALNEKLQLL